jgi:uncharacterized protein YrrD
MRKLKTLIGQDLVSLADGHRVGSVTDVVIDQGHDRMIALLVREAGEGSTAQAVGIDHVHSYGRDVIVIDREGSVQDVPDLPEVELGISSHGSLMGRTVLSEAGDRQGTISDVYIDEATGRVVGFEVSGGLLGDISGGRRFLPVEDIDHAVDEIVYIGSDAAASLRVSATQAMPGVAVAGETAPAQEASAGEAGADLVGRRSGADVTDETGSILVADGQRISEEVVARARRSDNVEALRMAAAAGDAAERERVVGAAVEQTRDAVGSLWDRFTRMLTEATEASGQRHDEQRAKARLAEINDAVGRPVTKVVLDRSDDVVLNLGDIITHEAVQRAHEAGVLDSLLASAYRGEVSFERDEMKARAEATSTIEHAGGGAAVVQGLQAEVETTEDQRRQEGEQRSRDDEEARSTREGERSDRARLREEASQVATGQPESGSVEESRDRRR